MERQMEILAKQLINQLSGFTENEENFHLSLDFVMSNFKYHRFLSVDGHKVLRTLEGLKEKFLIHGQYEKADRFSSLYEEFLKQPKPTYSNIGQNDQYYAMLLLLTLLADSPTHVDYVPEEQKSASEGTVDRFDFKAYLLDGEDAFQTFSDDSPSSDDESDNDDEKTLTAGAQRQQPISVIRKPASSASLTDNTILAGVSSSSVCDPTLGSEWLVNNVMTPYWLGARCKVDPSNDVTCSNLNEDWEAYMRRSDPLHTSNPKMILTEYQICREIIWVLNGATSSFVFVWDGNSFSVNNGISLSHLTDGSLLGILSVVSAHASIIQRLTRFIETTVGIESATERKIVDSKHQVGTQCGIQKGSSVLPELQTYRAFAVAISEALNVIRARLCEIESCVAKLDDTITISSVLDQCQESFKELEQLDTILTKGIEAVGDMTSAAGLATHLLNVIYSQLQLVDWLNSSGSGNMIMLLLLIWCKTCRPYLNILDRWLYNGELVDPHKEFIFSCIISTVPALRSEKFLEQVISLNTTSTTKESQLPQFLLPILRDILVTGKSVALLQRLGYLKIVSSANNSVIGERQTLHEALLDGIASHLSKSGAAALPDEYLEYSRAGKHANKETDKDKTRDKETVEQAEERKNIQTVEMPPKSSATGRKFMELAEGGVEKLTEIKRAKDDALLVVNMERLFLPDDYNEDDVHKVSARFPKYSLRRLESLLRSVQAQAAATADFETADSAADNSTIAAVTSAAAAAITAGSLYTAVRERREFVCSSCVQLILHQYQLIQYISAIRHVYLMEAGHSMHEFNVRLFEEVSETSWSEYHINSLLQDALGLYHEDLADRFYISVRNDQMSHQRSSSQQIISSLCRLRLSLKVDWPINMIISEWCLERYSEIFQFLLQIKYIKHSLDSLHFSDLMLRDEGGGSDLIDKQQLVHRLQLFRMQLLQFVNSLNSFIMTRTLHSLTLKFDHDLQQVSDLEELNELHLDYVRNVHERCLLHEKVKGLKDIIQHVLHLALVVSDLWKNEVNSSGRFVISTSTASQSLDNAEAEFSRCISFLSSLISGFSGRHLYSHLDSLSFALVTCSQAVQATKQSRSVSR